MHVYEAETCMLISAVGTSHEEMHHFTTQNNMADRWQYYQLFQKFLQITNLTHNSFFVYIYSSFLHVSSTLVFIIRRINCINMKYTRCHIHTIYFPDDEHTVARNMYRTGINIYEKRIVRQDGYIQELNRDARSTKHKKTWIIFDNITNFCKGKPCSSYHHVCVTRYVAVTL